MRSLTKVELPSETYDIFEWVGLEKGYSSFRSAYGAISKQIEESCPAASDYLDESIYFKALEKLGILKKGRLLADGSLDEDGMKYYPGDDEAREALINIPGEYASFGIYMRKRKSWGFATNAPEFNSQVVQPMRKLLCNFLEELMEKKEALAEARKQIKASGIQLPPKALSWNNVRADHIKKFFRND